MKKIVIEMFIDCVEKEAEESKIENEINCIRTLYLVLLAQDTNVEFFF